MKETFNFSLVDYTNVLLDYLKGFSNQYNNSTVFNPSIAHIRGDTYLCAFRIFKRAQNYLDLNDIKSIQNRRNQDNKYHPWYGGNKSSTWWKPGNSGYDQTIILVLNIVDDIVSVNTSYKFKILPFRVDARLANCCTDEKEGGDSFIVSYNVWVRNKDIKIKNGKDCKNSCGLIGASLILLRNSEIVIGEEVYLCPDISNHIEKNWSFWVYNNVIFFSYGLDPLHEVYQIRIVDEKLVCGIVKKTSSVSPFKNLLEYYKHENVFISTSTPALKLDSGYYIGVGHIKYKNNVSYPVNSQLEKFRRYARINSIRSEHPIYDYLMFFYIFEPISGEVKTVSKMFIPTSTNILAFPSGLCYTSDFKIMLSYGDNDSKCKFVTFTLDSIRDNLIDSTGIIPISKNLQFVEIIPENSMMLDTPENSMMLDTPEISMMLDTPENSMMLDTPRLHLIC